jgi:hypothetical protein
MTAPAASIAQVEVPETIQARRIGLHVALGRAIVKDPSILEEIPNHAVVALIPHDADETFIDAEVALGIDALRRGRSVYFKRLAPGEWGIDGEPSTAE